MQSCEVEANTASLPIITAISSLGGFVFKKHFKDCSQRTQVTCAFSPNVKNCILIKLPDTQALQYFVFRKPHKKKKKYLWAVLQSPHRTVSQNHFLKNSNTWGSGKNVISSNLLRISVFLLHKQPHVTLKCCLYMFHFMNFKALLFQEPISKTVFEVYFKFKHLSSKVKHLHC